MNKTYVSFTSSEILFLFIPILMSLDTSIGDPRAQTIEMTCGKDLEHNRTIFASNFVVSMRNISNRMGTDRFGIAMTGTGANAHYGLAQCYEDLSSADCVLCFAEAQGLVSQCFPFIAGRVFLDGCFVRSDGYSFFKEYAGPGDKAVCGNMTRKITTFHEATRQAVLQAVSAAPNTKVSARAQVAISGTVNESAYVLADCWKTLSMSDCRACLDSASSSVLGCLPRTEGRALNTGCFMRYSDKDFLNKESGGGASRGTKIVIAVSVVSSIVIFVVGMITGVYIWKKKRIQKNQEEVRNLGALLANVKNCKLRYKYKTLEKATNYFNDGNKLGQGGSGSVYKGILPDGKTVAIKRLFLNTRQWLDHFFNEVDLIGGIHHKNLVKLLGYSVVGPESLLVYEYVPNGSLQDHIFGKRNPEQLAWGVRYNIILGTAQGLAYLHEESNTRIIHRDIKLSNVLLDEDFTAKIADFGLARLFPEDKTHVSISIVGTLGYMAPEYVVRGKVTEKADVYSFGVLVTVVVSGRRNNSFSQNAFPILQTVWNLYGAGRLCDAVDPVLNGDFHYLEATRLLQIGLLCAQASAEMRPSMSMVVKMLTDICEIPQPTHPPFLKMYNSAEISPSFPSSSYSSNLRFTNNPQE